MNKEKIILIADDSSVSRKFIFKTIGEDNYEVLQAVDGMEAIEFMQTKNVDLIFLDLLMPEMDGIEVLIKMKELSIQIPVIVLTADIQDEVNKECIDLGIKEFLKKPAKENEILEAVAKYLYPQISFEKK